MDIAKVEKKGEGQVVNLPREFQFKGSEVYIKRIGRMVVLIPKENPWELLIDSLDQFTDDFMAERRQPAMAERGIILMQFRLDTNKGRRWDGAKAKRSSKSGSWGDFPSYGLYFVSVFLRGRFFNSDSTRLDHHKTSRQL